MISDILDLTITLAMLVLVGYPLGMTLVGGFRDRRRHAIVRLRDQNRQPH